MVRSEGIQLFRLREEGLLLLSERDISFKWSDNTFPIISSLTSQIIKFADLSHAELEWLQHYINSMDPATLKRLRNEPE